MVNLFRARWYGLVHTLPFWGFLILTGIQAKDFNESEPPVSDTVRFQEADQHVWKFKPVNGTLCRRLWDETAACWLTDWIPV